MIFLRPWCRQRSVTFRTATPNWLVCCRYTPPLFRQNYRANLIVRACSTLKWLSVNSIWRIHWAAILKLAWLPTAVGLLFIGILNAFNVLWMCRSRHFKLRGNHVDTAVHCDIFVLDFMLFYCIFLVWVFILSKVEFLRHGLRFMTRSCASLLFAATQIALSRSRTNPRSTKTPKMPFCASIVM